MLLGLERRHLRALLEEGLRLRRLKLKAKTCLNKRWNLRVAATSKYRRAPGHAIAEILGTDVSVHLKARVSTLSRSDRRMPAFAHQRPPENLQKTRLQLPLGSLGFCKPR